MELLNQRQLHGHHCCALATPTTVPGFPFDPVAVTVQIQALQFEWAWQHPEKSLKTREVAARLGKRKMMGLKGKVLCCISCIPCQSSCCNAATDSSCQG